jgi:hypothetical protein
VSIILGIESSCDDTSASICVNGEILSNVIANQAVHHQFGGVVPELASRVHQQNIIPAVKLNGHLLFATCSVFEKENEQNINALLETGKFKIIAQQYYKGYTHQADTLFGALLQKIEA